VKWNTLRGNQLQLILGMLHGNRYGPLVFYNPVNGAIDTMDAYYGAGASASFLHYDDNMKSQRWTAMSANFIEM
jgi:hypothetical protein